MSEQSEKEWNSLPDEMKTACVKKMDMQTRLAFRLTSQIGQKMVDASKVHVSYANIASFKDLTVGLIVLEPVPYIQGSFSPKKNLVEYQNYLLRIGNLMRLGKIEMFQLNKLTLDWDFLTDFIKFGPFKFDHLVINYNQPGALGFLENCENVRRIELVRSETHVPFEEIANIPVVYKAMCVESYSTATAPELGNPLHLVKKWIKLDSPLGTKLLMSISADIRDYYFSYVAAFRPLLVSQRDAEEARIRTNNPEKHIKFKVDFDQNFVYCVVVPADLVDEDQIFEIIKQ